MDSGELFQQNENECCVTDVTSISFMPRSISNSNAPSRMLRLFELL